MNCSSLHIDWQVPWLQDLRATGQAVLLREAGGASVAQALNADAAVASTGVRFVPQAALPAGEPYERHIFQTGTVPTRDNLHDFFNGLAWLHFPQTKTRLNQLQAAAIAQQGVQPVRGPLRDALTVLDENAAFLQAPQPLWDALQDRDWRRLFITLRPLWADAQLVLFGHALLEKLVAPYKSITAHVYRSPVPSGCEPAGWDAWLADQLTAASLASKPFTPLPVLGVPGWWPANEDPAFYLDSAVFRAARTDATGANSTPVRKNRT